MKVKKLQFNTNVNGDIVSYTSKTAKIKKGDITQQHIDKSVSQVKSSLIINFAAKVAE